jgi:hypothetical protein
MMGQAIGGSLPLAVGIALSPVPIIAVVLMLTSRQAHLGEIGDRVIGYGRAELAAAMRSSAVVVGLVLG